MAISKEQWEQIERQLGGVFGRVELVCDGYKVHAQVQQTAMKLVIAVYVDDFIKGEWMFNEAKSEIPLKFHQEKKRFFFSPKLRKLYTKWGKSRMWTKEERARYAEDAKRTCSHWWPYWTSATAFCRHLRKTCTSIEIVKIGY